MDSRHFSIILLLGTVTIVSITEGKKKLFCYYSSDSRYRTVPGKFTPENIDPHLCTHIIFAFFQPTQDGLNVRPEQDDHLGPNGLYARTVALKQRNPSLRVLLAIGGWVIGSKPFLPIIASPASTATFCRNVVAFLRQHQMDGMDMDWEFPGVRGSTSNDKPMFTMLLKTLQDEFTREAARTGREKLILTLATAAGTYYIEEGYETEQIVKYPDYLLLMTYNYHGSWENVTGHHSAVWSSYKDTGPRVELNMKWTVDFWLSRGARRDKTILGLATYGMTFTLKDPRVNGVLAPAYGGGHGAQYTKEYGIMAYYEVCENLAQNGWTKVWLQDQKVPYAYGGDQWVGYDDQESLRIKVQTLINAYNLAGAFVWSVEMDDFRGRCGQGPYPLIHTIIDTMERGGGTVPHVTYNPYPLTYPTTPRPVVVTPATAYPEVYYSDCIRTGRTLFKDWTHCGQFVVCVRGLGRTYRRYTMRCPPRTTFDDTYLVCLYDPNCV